MGAKGFPPRADTSEIRAGGADNGNYILDPPNEGQESWNDRLVCKGLPLLKAYRKGWLKLCFFIDPGEPRCGVIDSDNWSLLIRAPYKSEVARTSEIDRQIGLQAFDVVDGESCALPDRNDQMVLVANVQFVKPAKFFVPCRIGLARAYRSPDPLTGELYLVPRYGTFHGLTVLTEREIDAPGIGGGGTCQTERQDVERRPKVMDRVANNQCEPAWDGLIGFDGVLSLCNLWILPDPELERVQRHIGVNFLVKIGDMMIGPLDL